MDAVSHLQRLLDFDDWANRQVVSALRKSHPLPSEALRLLNHIAGAELLWLARIHDRTASVAVWPELSLEQCERELARAAEMWRALLRECLEDALQRKVAYRNSKGEPWSSRVEDIILHVTMHSAYHRGQIAREMRSSGAVPAYTDFIHAVRNRFIE